MKALFIKATLVVLFLNSHVHLLAQCVSNVTVGTCVGCTANITSNLNINPGDKYCWSSGSTSVSNINFGGGTLVVCGGTVTINSGNLNAGAIYVNAGAQLIFNMNVNMANFTIVNFGTITFNNPVAFQPVSLFNNASGLIYFNSSVTLNGSSLIVNSNVIYANVTTIQTSSQPAICQNTDAQFYCTQFNNNVPVNSVQSPSGQSCFNISTGSLLNSNVSPHSDLYVCLGLSYVGTTGSATFGSATDILNCGSCSYALPISLVSFDARNMDNRTVNIDWTTATENNNDYFTVQRSQDGINWHNIQTIDGSGNSNVLLSYTTADSEPLPGVSYYRLKQTDFDGKYEYSEIKSVDMNDYQLSFVQIYPNPTDQFVRISGSEEELSCLVVTTILGQEVTDLVFKSNETDEGIILDLTNLSVGVYYVKTAKTSNLLYKN
ncbi:MAG: hypothetical protein RLZ33_2233 [Bacteroidota bacterium]|jgi:hypothetical protein